MVKLLVAHY